MAEEIIIRRYDEGLYRWTIGYKKDGTVLSSIGLYDLDYMLEEYNEEMLLNSEEFKAWKEENKYKHLMEFISDRYLNK